MYKRVHVYIHKCMCVRPCALPVPRYLCVYVQYLFLVIYASVCNTCSSLSMRLSSSDFRRSTVCCNCVHASADFWPCARSRDSASSNRCFSDADSRRSPATRSCVCVRVCVCIYIYVYICVHIQTHAHAHKHTHTRIYIYICVCV